MTMKKFCVFCVVMLVAAISMANDCVSPMFSMRTEMVSVVDGEDVDLYLDCFENAVKAKDMELAAKIANVLYGMEMNGAQLKRFSAIEDKISKKDYRVYRDNLRAMSYNAKTSTDNYRYAENDDVYVQDYGIDEESSFVDDIVDSFSAFFDELGADADSSSWHYERHDTIDGGGMVDVFVDAFNRFLFDDGNAEISDKSVSAEEAEIDALLDEYEKYVNLSVGALREVMSGNKDAMDDFDKYSHEASALSDKIAKTGNGMNSRQFKRYMHILGDMFSGMF